MPNPDRPRLNGAAATPAPTLDWRRAAGMPAARHSDSRRRFVVVELAQAENLGRRLHRRLDLDAGRHTWRPQRRGGARRSMRGIPDAQPDRPRLNGAAATPAPSLDRWRAGGAQTARHSGHAAASSSSSSPTSEDSEHQSEGHRP